MNDLDDIDVSAEDFDGLDEPSLLKLLETFGDTAPRGLIEACGARGAPMVDAIERLVGDPDFWAADLHEKTWWLRLHTAMILGLINSERAGFVLVDLMRRLDEDGDVNTQDWLSGHWPLLFERKPAAVSTALTDLAQDRSRDVFVRMIAVDAVACLRHHHDPDALENTLVWAAGMAADDTEDNYLRYGLGHLLLDFPRLNHRSLLEALAAEQSGFHVAFDAEDIDAAYGRGADEPSWRRFRDPWRFYDHEAILARQRRWEGEDSGADQEPRLLELPPTPQTYVRENAKIGRNDPCPCGSGRKYKKCCLTGTSTT